ncbi:hypothetical protein Tco_0267212 [Tanacetum coccineum]
MEKHENENVSLELQVQSLIKERKNVKMGYQKIFGSVKKTQTQSQREINELINSVNQKTYAYGDVNIEKKQDVHTQATKSVLTSTRLKGVTSVRRPQSRSSLSKNNVLSNTKNQSEVLEVHVRTNKNTNVTSRKNVVKPKNIEANIDVKNALKANNNALCVFCYKNVLISCRDKCLVKYKLSVHLKVRRTLFTTPRTSKSKSLDTTPVVAKTRFAIVTTLNAKNKDSSASQSTLLFAQENTLRNYMRTKAKTSRKWQNGLNDNQTLVGHLRVVQIVLWIVDSGCSKHMTGDLKLLKYFVKKFMGTVRLGNDHFVASIGYDDYVHGNVTICHVYYV